MSSLATIYKATCLVNSKSYVGFTINWPERRAKHLPDSSLKAGYPFHRAIKKYGKENFVWEVLYQSTDAEFCLKVMEEKMIREHKTHISENGYNLTYGGQGWLGMKHHPETILKLKKPKTEEVKQKFRGRRPHVIQRGHRNNNAKVVQTPYGTFGSIKDAAAYLSTRCINIDHLFQRGKSRMDMYHKVWRTLKLEFPGWKRVG